MQKLFFTCLLNMSILYAFASHAAIPANDEASEEMHAASRVIYLVRHFEKEAKQQLGITGQDKKDPHLTEVGNKRAISLASYLKDKNIAHVFSTQYTRTMQTARPTAELFNLDVIQYDPRQLNAFAERILKATSANLGNILIVGHSNTTPELLRLLGGPELSLSESDYGDLFVLDLTCDLQIHAQAPSKVHSQENAEVNAQVKTQTFERVFIEIL